MSIPLMKYPLVKIVFAVLLLAPILSGNEALAITSSGINAEVQIVCPDSYGYVLSGSGTMISADGLILTNRHVILDTRGMPIEYCLIGLTESLIAAPTLDYIAQTILVSDADDIDAAILKIVEPERNNFAYFDVFSKQNRSPQLGDSLDVIGYPNIGGSTITYVNGVVAGFEGGYIKTTAPLEHGNSGGSAFDLNGNFVGIPTAVTKGELNSISWILSISSIESWLSGILGLDFQTKVQQESTQAPITTPVTPSDATPPDISELRVSVYSDSSRIKGLDFWGTQSEDNLYVELDGLSDASGIRGYFIYFGRDKFANPKVDGVYTAATQLDQTATEDATYYLIVQAADGAGNVSATATFSYHHNVTPEWAIGTIHEKIIDNQPNVFYVYSFDGGVKGQLLQTVLFDSSTIQNVSVPTNNVYIEWTGIEDRNFITKVGVRFENFSINDSCKKQYQNEYAEYWQLYKDSGYDWSVVEDSDPYHVTQTCEHQYDQNGRNNFISRKQLTVGSTYRFQMDEYFEKDGKQELAGSYEAFRLVPTAAKVYTEDPLIERTVGRILLQVQAHGEAWYVNPVDKLRYYMADGAVAYQMMRSFGLGITDANLSKIPSVASTTDMQNAKSICASNAFAKQQRGKILLQIQQHGEAWYVDPARCYRIYLKNGSEAYSIMKYLSLGIADSDLTKIAKGAISTY